MNLGDGRRREWLVLGCLFVLISLVFADVIFFGSAFFDRDSYRYYYPTKRIIHEIVGHGEFPWWNPYYEAGQPLAANPEYEIFYPLLWLVFLPSYHVGYCLHIIAHLYLAACGMFWFLRSRHLGIAAATWGALAFVFGGWMVSSMASLLPFLFGSAWIPLILLFATRFVEKRRWFDFSAAAILLGVQATTGEPTTLLQSWILVVAFCVWLPGESQPGLREAVRRAVAATGIVACGLLVGAVQIVPGFDLVRDSVRSDSFGLGRTGAWSLAPLRPLEWFFPHVLGIASAVGERFWAYRLYPQKGYPFMLNLYFGLGPMALAVAGFVRRLHGTLWLAALAGMSYLVAVGVHTPLLKVLYGSGLLENARYPEKFILIALIALIVASAIAFDELVGGDRAILKIAMAVVGVTVLLAVAFRAVPLTQYAITFVELWKLPRNGQTFEWLEASRHAWTVAALRGGGVLVALGLCWKRPSRGAWVLVALLALDLSRLSAVVAPRLGRSFFESEPPVAGTLYPDRSTYRLFHEAALHEEAAISGQYLDSADRRYWVVRNGMFPQTPASWGFRTVLERDYDLTALRSTREFERAMWEVRGAQQPRWAEMFMAMSNARYHVFYRPTSLGLVGREPKDVDPTVFVEAKNPQPRYYFADCAITVRSRADFVRELVLGDWTPTTAYVPIDYDVRGGGTIRNVEERSASVELAVDSGPSSLLVLSVTRDRHWRASVDGEERGILPVDLTYMGIALSKGTHVVRLEYWNPWVVVGAAISLGAVLFLVVLAFATRRKSERPTLEGALPEPTESS